MPRQPYNPSRQGPQVHDRRATDVTRGSVDHVVAVEVDDPFDASARIVVMRSTRSDPLGDHYVRGLIDEASYKAGRQYQEDFGVAERGPKAMTIGEMVDGNPPRENLTDQQIVAFKWLARCHQALGGDGVALIQDMLIAGQTAKAIAEARGLKGKLWESYYAKRFRECLNTLARIYGFASS